MVGTSPSLLVEQALGQIDKLSRTIAKLVAAAKPDESVVGKREQLYDLTQIIKQWETKTISVPDDIRLMQLNLSADLNCFNENVVSLDRVREKLQELLDGIPKDGIGISTIKKKRKPRSRIISQPKTKGAVFRQLILDILKDFGGRARRSRVMAEIERRLGASFTSADLELEPDGKTLSWWKTTQWERNRLILRKVMKGDSPNGMWELAKK